MKVCPNCRNTVEDSAVFCDKCGTRFAVQNNTTANYAQQPTNQPNYAQQPQYNYGVNQSQFQNVPQTPPKKKNIGMIIGIIAAVVIVLAIIGSVAEKVFQNQGYGNDNYNDYYVNDDSYSFNADDNNNSWEISDSYETPAEPEHPVKPGYSKGSFDGSVYTNEWADIKLALPEGFSNADAATYSSAENSTTECGAYFIADDTMSLIYICYEKLPTYPVYDEEEYLDAVMQSLESISEIDYTTPKTYFTANIAGYPYAKAECEFSNDYGNFSNTFYVRKLDNYIIAISAVGVDAEANTALVNKITNIK